MLFCVYYLQLNLPRGACILESMAEQPAQGGKQATWGGRFSEQPAALMQLFSESVSFDQKLALFDIRGSKAHAAMLAHVGLLQADDAAAIQNGLDAIAAEIEAGTFTWDIALEDVHMNIEAALTQRVPAAARLHTARSRNDQIATAMRLYFKDACGKLVAQVQALQGTLLDLAERHLAIRIPGYTHLQRAQPVPLAHHLLAWVEMLGRDVRRFRETCDHADECPLGSGALAGSTLPIDRAFTARELGFARPTANSMDTVADRDLFHEFAHACALVGVHLSRMAEDVILWNSAEFGFIKLPDTFTTGSSLMPQKKNPDCMELIRGKAGRLQGHVTALLAMVKGLPLTYNRDLQEDKPPVFDACEQTLLCLAVMQGALADATFDADKCARAVSDPLLLATDLADELVRVGVPFREAHHIVGALVAAAEKAACPLNALSDEQVQRVDARIPENWRDVFDLDRALHMREKPGMPGPKQVQAQLTAWREKVQP